MNAKVEEFIIQASYDELIDWLSFNGNLINRFVDSLENRIKQFQFDSSGHDIAKLLNLFIVTDQTGMSVAKYRLIKQASLNQLSNDTCEINVDEAPYLSIVDLFESNAEKMCDKCLKQIYHDIVNLYIPCDDPELMISLFMKHYPITEIMENKNSDWFCDRYNKTEELLNHYMMKEMLLLFKYIVDILSNEESRFDHVGKLQDYYSRYYRFQMKFDEISDRYEKYFKDDTRYIITQLIDLLLSNDVNNDVHDFLVDWSGKYSVRANAKIINCFICEVKLLVNIIRGVSLHIDTMKNASTMLLDNWGNPKYNVEKDDDSFTVLSENDTPISYLTSIATEAVHGDSAVMNDKGKKIYRAYKNYKEAEEKVDSQITKALNGIKGVLIGDVRSEVIEGKKFSAIGLLKQLLGTVAIFSTGKIRGVIVLVTKYALKKKTTIAERRAIIMDLETEIEIISEKIDDAKGDNNREAKYAMMRTKKELEHALTRIQYGMEADRRTMSNAKQILDQSRGGV